MRLHVYHARAAPRIEAAVREALPGHDVTAWTRPEELAAGLGEVEVLFTATAPGLDWSGATRLRLVQLMGAGADGLLPADGLPAGVQVAGLRGVFAAEASEHAIALLLALARGLPTLVARQAERRWRPFASAPLEGSTLCVVGLGAIGARVARIGAALGMRVVGVRRRPAPVAGVERVRGPDELLDALAEADHAVITLPLTPGTRGLIDADALAALRPTPTRPTARLVQVGRGGVLDEAALLAALRDGRLGGAALDVFEEEPLPPESPLWDAPNLIVSPHLAGLGLRYLERAVEALADNVRSLDEGRPLRGLVDVGAGY